MGKPWKVHAHSDASQQQQNAFLYDSSKVNLHSAEFVSKSKGSTELYPTHTFRAPATAVFSPKRRRAEKFRVINIHGHWEDENIRNDEGHWLAGYVESLLSARSETKHIVLVGDFNGIVPAAPHNGICSKGQLTMIPKRNGYATVVSGFLDIDHIYVTDSTKALLTDPSCFVVKPPHYGESVQAFRATCSDHLPVFIELRFAASNAKKKS